ncbi:MAG: hypothetical protein QM493_05885 [Sulfurovum sp.]
MIKVFKDLDNIPDSLLDRKTEKRRNICIKDNKYHQKKEFHQRYKQADIKATLKLIYHEKCAFCEKKIRECKDNNLEECSSTVEHYRPKSKYHWLAYSWDNLLWCCHRCNQNKDNNFETLADEVSYEEEFRDNIHSSTEQYQEMEKPKIINPELENILEKLSFDDGIITSDDVRVQYTIETCGLDRDSLNDNRQTIIDDFVESMIDKQQKNESLGIIFKELMSDFKNQESEFRALRFWLLKNYQILV